MKLIGKHSSVLVALSIFCLPTLLIVYFQFAQWQQQKYMEREMEDRQLQSISLPVDEVRWFKVNKEVLIEGKLFDVKEFHQDGSTIVFTGLFDEKETEISNNIVLIKNTEENNRKNSELAQHYFSIQLFSSWQTIELPTIFHFNITQYNIEKTLPLSSLSFAIITPPPEA